MSPRPAEFSESLGETRDSSKHTVQINSHESYNFCDYDMRKLEKKLFWIWNLFRDDHKTMIVKRFCEKMKDNHLTEDIE